MDTSPQDEIQDGRERDDMCAAFAVESLIGTVTGNESYQVPKWVLQSRIKYCEEHRDDDEPDNDEELGWLNSTLRRLGGELHRPLQFNLTLEEVSDIADVNKALSRGNEIFILGRTSDYNTPHMFHLGKYKADIFGRRFESLQQITYEINLADYFMRFKKCNAAFIKPITN